MAKAISSTLRFIHDPSHGWLEVPMKDIRALGIRCIISSFSFIDAGNAYLEQDGDVGVYFRAVERHGIPPPEVTPVYVEKFDRDKRRF